MTPQGLNYGFDPKPHSVVSVSARDSSVQDATPTELPTDKRRTVCWRTPPALFGERYSYFFACNRLRMSIIAGEMSVW